jgi:ribokinase
MAPPPRVAVIGSANTDLITFTDAFPRAGETLFGQRFDLGFGGKGANQAVAARLCGAEVLMVAKVGDDLFGEATVRNFASRGIDTSQVKVVPGVSTGAAAILVEPSGENRIIVVKGANDELRAADIDAAAAQLRQVDTIILQFEVPLDTVYHAVHFARTHGIRCIVNPAPALAAELARLVEADYLIPNETEAEQLSGRPVSTLDQARDCANELLRRGFQRLVLTLGSRGSLIAGPEGFVHVAPYEVTPIDTTGAGDAFIGSLAVFLAEGLPERQAVAAANLYAALSTTRVGTQKSFPTRSEFDRERARRIGP